MRTRRRTGNFHIRSSFPDMLGFAPYPPAIRITGILPTLSTAPVVILQHWWKMDTLTVTTVPDSGASPLDGTSEAGVALDITTDPDSFIFAGTGGVTTATLDMAAPFTIELEVLFGASYGAANYLIAGGANGFVLGLNSNGTMFFSKNGVSNVNSTGTVPDTGDFQTLKWAYTGAACTMYLGGVSLGAPAYSATFTGGTGYNIGGLAGGRLTGKMRNVKIWNGIV